jgi:hypothetical protein
VIGMTETVDRFSRPTSPRRPRPRPEEVIRAWNRDRLTVAQPVLRSGETRAVVFVDRPYIDVPVIGPPEPGARSTLSYLPTPVDLHIYAGDEIIVYLSVLNGDGTPADLTVETGIRAQVRETPDSLVVLGEFQPEVDPLTPNVAKLRLNGAITQQLPPICVWDCEISKGQAFQGPQLLGTRTLGNVTPVVSAVLNVGRAVPAPAHLIAAAAVGFSISEYITPVGFTDSAGNIWDSYTLPGFSPGNNSQLYLWESATTHPLATTDTVTVPLPGTTAQGRVLAGLYWLPGALTGIVDSAHRTLVTQVMVPPWGLSTPFGSAGQTVLTFHTNHTATFDPIWVSTTQQLGPLLFSNTNIAGGGGRFLVGTDYVGRGMPAALPQVGPTPESTNVPNTASMVSVAFATATPAGATVAAGTITTTGDVTR